MIDYIVFPKSDLNEASEAKISELGLVPRKNRDGSKLITKCQHYAEIFSDKIKIEVRIVDEQEIETKVYPYPIYSGAALNELLSSSEWSWTDEEIPDSNNESASATPVGE